MKKKTLLLVSTSFALGVGLIGAGVGASLHQKAPTNKIMEDVTLPDDNIGARVKLAAENDNPLETAPTFVNTLGYRVIDEESGAKSVRVYAVTTGYKGLNGVSVTRSVKDSSGASVMAEKTIQFGYVYSSIRDADLVNWDEALPEESETVKNYYMVFTLKNIPESHWFDEIDVQFSLDNGAIINSNKAVANVKGLMPKDEGVGVTLAKYESTGVIYAVKSSSAITEAVVPEDYITYEGHVATFVGKVTRLGNPGTPSNGAFESCSYLTTVTLPDTITEMGGWTFGSSPKLTSVRLPRDLQKVHSSCWSSSSFKTLYYDAVNFTNTDGATISNTSLKEIVISSDVESLPNKFIYSNVTLNKVIYKGTLAAFEALKTEDNAENGLFIDNVFATDNVVSITYHLPEGVTLDDKTGEFSVDFVTGKAGSFGTALKSGYKFDGWYTDEALSTPLDTSLPVSSSMNLYPKFTEFGPGISETKPIVLGEENATFTETLVPEYEEVYFKYTAPSDAVAGWRYVRINAKASTTNKDLSVDVSDLGNQKLFFYKDSVSDENLIDESTSTTLTDTAKVQRIAGDDGYKRIYVEPGQTYIIVADAYYSTYYTERHWYGDLVIEWSKAEHDSIDTASSIALNEEKEIAPTYKGQPLSLYKFTPTETKKLAVYVNSSQNFNASVSVYDVTDGTIKGLGTVDYKYVSGSTGITTGNKSFEFEAGHTYILAPSTTEVATEDKFASFKIGALPAGTSASDPISYTFGETVTVEQISGPDVYYSFVLESEQNIQISINGGSSYIAKYLKLLSSEGNEIADAGEEVAEEERGWYGDTETYYGRNPLAISTTLSAGTYVIKTGYVSGSSFGSFTLSSKAILPGETFGNPVTVEPSDGGIAEFAATTAGMYYKVVAAETGYIQFNIASSTAKLSLLNTAGKVVSSAGNGQFFYTNVNAGDEILLKADGGNETITATITYPSTIHDGKSVDTAYELDFTGSDTTDITYASGSSSVNGIFFKFSVATSGTYRLYTNNPSVDTQVNGVYEEDDTSNRIAGTYTDDDRGEHSPFTDYRFDTYNEVTLEAGKIYYISMKIGANSSNVAILLGLTIMAQGDNLANPIAKAWNGDAITFEDSNGIKYYSFTSDVTGTYDLDVTSSDEKVTPTITLYSNDKIVSSLSSNKLRFAFEADKEYVFEVKTSESINVSITRTVHVGIFTGSGLQGTYIGARNGASYYKAAITDDDVSFEGRTGYEPDGTPVTTDGITSFVASGKTYFTNGTDMVVYEYSGSPTFYFFSKRLSTYTEVAVSGQIAKTTDATISQGIVIQSICIDGGSRIYCAVKDGTIYFDATVEFASSDESDVSTCASGFTVKDANGNVIGTYTSSDKTLTEVTSPAA